jgi:hypothetical protein
MADVEETLGWFGGTSLASRRWCYGWKVKEKGETGKRKSSGPNAYMKFSKEMRPKIVAENPKMKSDVIAVAREIGKRWRHATSRGNARSLNILHELYTQF